MPTPRVTIDDLPLKSTPDVDDGLIIQDSGVTKRTTVSGLTGLPSTALTAHLADTTDAHDATAISATDSGSGVNGVNVQAQLIQLAAGIGTGGGSSTSGIVIDDVPPVDTTVLWADTTAPSDVTGDTVVVHPYTDESDARPTATVVFWVPTPVTLGNPFAAVPGDCVLRTSENPVQGINGITGLWQGTPTEYEALSSYDPDTVYFVVAP